MAKRIDVDPVLLGDAAMLVAEIGERLAAARNEAARIMEHTEVACGDDHFGREFAGGPRGFRSRGEAVEEKTGRISEVVSGMAEDMALGHGAAQAHRDTDKSSADMFRRQR